MTQENEGLGAGFTPGPWHVGEVRHAGAFQLVTAGDKGYVCEVRCGFLGNDLDHATREANAALIAAAPDLAEDGQFLADRLTELDGASGDPAEFMREFYGHVAPALTRFRAAISKALGKAA
jgi:hypothetical protein